MKRLQDRDPRRTFASLGVLARYAGQYAGDVDVQQMATPQGRICMLLDAIAEKSLDRQALNLAGMTNLGTDCALACLADMDLIDVDRSGASEITDQGERYLRNALSPAVAMMARHAARCPL